jgi:hypothetical protein
MYIATLVVRTFCALVIIAAAFNLKIWQYNAVNAFINSCVDKKIFYKCPDRFRRPGYC